MSSSTRQQLEEWLKGIMVSGHVLDVGGSQLPVEGRVHKMPETEFYIMDLEQPHETKTKPDYVFDIEGESLPDDGMFQKFDSVFCLEVSEYWIKPDIALTNMNFCLKKGGTLYISFHFVYPVHEPQSMDSLRYTRMGVSRLLKETGFEIKKLVSRRADYFDLLHSFHVTEGMRPSKEYKFHDEVGILIEAIKI